MRLALAKEDADDGGASADCEPNRNMAGRDVVVVVVVLACLYIPHRLLAREGKWNDWTPFFGMEFAMRRSTAAPRRKAGSRRLMVVVMGVELLRGCDKK